MAVTRKEKIAGGIAAAAVATVAAVGVIVADNDPAPAPVAAPMALADGPAFQATFNTADDFYNRFDYGLSGLTDGVVRQQPTHGDHNLACEGPTTLRDAVLVSSNPIYRQFVWWCAPGGPDTGHVMTGISTDAYNILWFAPKPSFTGVTKVCYDINETEISHRKWTQVMFVGAADAVRYPDGKVLQGPNWVARGTGGFDLGFTSPDFRAPNFDGPTSGIEPQGGTLAGLKVEQNAPSWFQDQDSFSFRGFGLGINGITDKAARYEQCLENLPNNTVRFTQATPTGPRTFDMPGQIPQAAVRVVFQDDNYNGPKGDAYNRDIQTWHWDNIRIFTSGGQQPPPTTTLPATTTTTRPPTTTTRPPTTTTTLPGTTTTTVPASPCPASFTAAEKVWCEQVEARLRALET
jgi:hypothetical protein